jgi:hypothetical protein
VAIDEHKDQRVSIVPPVEPLLLPPFHQQFGHRDVKVRIYTMPKLEVPPPQLSVPRSGHVDAKCGRNSSTCQSGINPHVGLTKGHEGRNVQDPRRDQIV